MWNSKLSRRRFLALSGSALASTLLGSALGQAASGGSGGASGGGGANVLRLGMILPPSKTSSVAEANAASKKAFAPGAIGEVIGYRAHNGTEFGASEIATDVNVLGYQLDVKVASAAGAEAVTKAAERLHSEEEAYAIIGGFSTEEALALSQLAAKKDFIFLNIGAQSNALRNESCNSHTFHLASSAQMYLDGMTDWYVHSGFRRWFFVYNDSDEQKANHVSAGAILKSRHFGGGEVGSTMVKANESNYKGVFDDIKKAKPDLVVMLLEPLEQLTFLEQYETSGLDMQTVGYPSPVTQTRKFFLTTLQVAPKAGGASRHEVMWEATLNTFGARELNSRFLTNYDMAMETQSWIAYMGIKTMAEAAEFAGSNEASKLIPYLESPQTIFDIYKGAATSFRPWNHQLRQTLNLVKVNTDYQDKKSLQDLGILEGQLPNIHEQGVPLVKRLDQLGFSESESKCNLASGK